MKKIVTAIALCLPLAAVVQATEIPKFETYLGYDYIRFNLDSPFVPNFNGNGGSAQFLYNFNKWAGVAFDAGAVNKGGFSDTLADTTVIHFCAGPQVTFHNHSHFTPFIHALFGGAYSTTSIGLTAIPVVPPVVNPLVTTPGVALPLSVRVGTANTDFAMLIGGGFDIKLSKRVAFRPVSADYFLTRLPSLVTGDTTNRNNWRLSAGFNFMFGE